jgi:cytoskeletal protein CcmA (bactofilin family)
MGAAPQGMKSLSKYFEAVRESVSTGQEAAGTAVGVIVDTLANGPAALVRQDAPDSVIGCDLHINGTLSCSGDIGIDGTLVGEIRANGHVTVGKNGVVLGNIHAQEITVHGRVEGSLNARNVRLCRSCHVKGEVVHARVDIEDGAFFEGVAALPATRPSHNKDTQRPAVFCSSRMA